MDDAHGGRVGRFVLGEVIGRGGFGTVHRATDADLGRTVAVKLLPEPDRALRERAARELAITRALQSPHVMPLLEIVEGERGLGLVYPYVDGEDLQQILARGRLDLTQALQVASAAARGLAAAHAHGIIHSDVTPSNILVPRRAGALAFAEAMVTDFGVLGELRQETGTTMPGLLVGTPAYMSPEQLSGGELSPATDVHGLAAVLYEMIYGRRVHRSTTLYELMQEILRGEPALPDEPPVPRPLGALLLRSLSSAMEKRPRDASELLAELERLGSAKPSRSTGTHRADSGAPLVDPLPRGGDPLLPGTGSTGPRPGPPPIMGGPAVVIGGTAAITGGPAVITGGPSVITGGPADITGGPAVITGGPSVITGGPAVITGGPSVVTGGPVITDGPAVLAARTGTIARTVVAAAILAAGVLVFATLRSPWGWLALGLCLVAAGVAAALAVHRHLSAKESEVARRASRLLTGAESRDSLTQSLAIRLDDLWEQCRTGEQEIVWHTVAMMVREYQDARDSDDRQKALMNLVTLVGELQRRLSPWYVRHEKAVAFGVGLIGIASGATTTILAIAKALA